MNPPQNTSIFQLVGYIPSITRNDGFVIPVFRNGDDHFIQKVDLQKRIITDFDYINVDRNEIIFPGIRKPYQKEIGNVQLNIYQKKDNALIIGDDEHIFHMLLEEVFSNERDVKDCNLEVLEYLGLYSSVKLKLENLAKMYIEFGHFGGIVTSVNTSFAKPFKSLRPIKRVFNHLVEIHRKAKSKFSWQDLCWEDGQNIIFTNYVVPKVEFRDFIKSKIAENPHDDNVLNVSITLLLLNGNKLSDLEAVPYLLYINEELGSLLDIMLDKDVSNEEMRAINKLSSPVELDQDLAPVFVDKKLDLEMAKQEEKEDESLNLKKEFSTIIKKLLVFKKRPERRQSTNVDEDADLLKDVEPFNNLSNQILNISEMIQLKIDGYN